MSFDLVPENKLHLKSVLGWISIHISHFTSNIKMSMKGTGAHIETLQLCT